MMKFAQWLEATSPQIKFTAFWKDGTVNAYIDGARYVYVTDAAYHDQWQRLARHKPFAVLNQIKDLVNKGRAQQIEPKPVTPVMTQKTLF